MPFHVASHTKRFAAARLGALVGLLARVAVAVDAQAAWARKGLVACRANVPVLRLRECRLAGRADVVVMLPRVLAVGIRRGHGQRHLGLKVGR
jgi:hypothetical protein